MLEQILTGTFADGLGNVVKTDQPVDFDPFPWQSFAVWIMTQMKRWGQIKGDVDYRRSPKQVFLATDAAKADEGGGTDAADGDIEVVLVMGKTFDPAKPEDICRELHDQEGSG